LFQTFIISFFISYVVSFPFLNFEMKFIHCFYHSFIHSLLSISSNMHLCVHIHFNSHVHEKLYTFCTYIVFNGCHSQPWVFSLERGVTPHKTGTTLTSVVSSGTATEWILFFLSIQPLIHPGWCAGSLSGQLLIARLWLYTDYRYLPKLIHTVHIPTVLIHTVQIPTVLLFKNRRCRYRSMARHFGTSIGLQIG
jgi:hypothetical protein